MLYGKHIFLSILSAVSMLTMSSCMKEVSPDEPGDGDGGRGFYLSFDDGAGTRSELNSSEVDWRDVEDVYLYVFKGNTADTPCILFEDVDWQGNISQKHWVSADLESGETYTFMAVGVDDRAGSVYGFPAQEWKSLTLGTLVARYAGNDKSDMATAQLFAGYTAQKADDTEKAEVSITLRRKVAGVLAYLKNIPFSVDFSDANGGKAEVTSLRISLYQNQNTKMPMWSANPEVYGSEPMENSQVLFEVDMTQYKADSDGRYFVIPAKSGENGVQTLENSLLMGAFLLPVDNSGQDATLSLELIGEYTDSDGTEHEDVTVKSYSVTAEDGATEFPINENHLYSIGKKLSDGSTDGDKPADLSGNVILVFVTPWCEVDMDNTFPTVQGPARIMSDYDEEHYIFDAPGTEFYIEIKPAEPVSNWTLTVAYEGVEQSTSYDYSDEKDWIHFVGVDAEGNETGYVSKMQGSDGPTVKVVLNDFAVRRVLDNNYNIDTQGLLDKLKNDYRTAHIELYTDGSTEPYRLTVRQYNALTVYASAQAGDDGFRAAARLDYRCHFNKQTGKVERDANSATGWGFFSTVPSVIYGATKMNYYDGEDNTERSRQRYEEGALGTGSYKGCLMDQLRKEIINIGSNGLDTGSSEGIWYLPAYHEMWGVAHYVNPYRELGDECQELFNLKQGDKYWCSTCVDREVALTLYIPAGTTDYMRKGDRNDGMYSRPIRKFKIRQQ